MKVMRDRRQEILGDEKMGKLLLHLVILHDGRESSYNLFVVGSRFCHGNRLP
jgi:hypothetical protein